MFLQDIGHFFGERLFEPKQVEWVGHLHEAIKLLLGHQLPVGQPPGITAIDSEPRFGILGQVRGIYLPKKSPVGKVSDGILVRTQMVRYRYGKTGIAL
jgi:hypothetical protein